VLLIRRSGYSRCLNYIYADVYTLFFNTVLQKESCRSFWKEALGTISSPMDSCLITAVLMETAIGHGHPVPGIEYGRIAGCNIGRAHSIRCSFVVADQRQREYSLLYLFPPSSNATTLLIVWLAIRWKPAKEAAR